MNLILGSLTDFSGEIVLADSELSVYVDQLLAGVLEEETAGEEEEGREQVAEKQDRIQSDCPSVIVKDRLPVRNQEFQAIHEKKAESHEENQREK
jgi:hypothetical protein